MSSIRKVLLLTLLPAVLGLMAVSVLAVLHEVRDEIDELFDAQLIQAAYAVPATAPAQERANARTELDKIEWLGEVVVGAGVESGNARGRRVPGTDDEHGDVILLGSHPPQHLDAIGGGQPEIQNHEVVHAACDLGERRGAIANPVHRIAFVAQGFLYPAPDQAIIFDEEQPHQEHRQNGTTGEDGEQTLTLH